MSSVNATSFLTANETALVEDLLYEPSQNATEPPVYYEEILLEELYGVFTPGDPSLLGGMRFISIF